MWPRADTDDVQLVSPDAEEWHGNEPRTACMLRLIRVDAGGRIVATEHSDEEAAIRQQLNTLVAAIQAKDLDGVKRIYGPDIVSFDVEPPLQRLGVDGKGQNWEHAFALFELPITYEVRDLTIVVGDDVAFAHSLNRLSGTLQNGNPSSGFWVRATVCLQKIAGAWLIVHDHASVPLDFESGRALLNLEP
jgi:ketosteroid isomerase-like protein